MIKKSLLLMLLLAILAPWAAQAQETLTVYDGTTGTLTSNANVPMYGNYFDAYTKSEFVIPADQLSDMDGGTITSLKFYIQSVGTYGSGWSSNQQVFLKEVSSTSLSAFSGTDDATIVWEGSFTVPSSSDTEFEITFTTPYEYQGGNLLVGIYNITKGGYRNVAWYGQTVNGASGNGNNSSSLSGVPFSQKNFIPKTTFTYEAAASDCPKPNNLVASNVTAHTADLSWESDGIEFILQYKKASQSSWNEEWLDSEYLDFPYTLTGLAAETEYQVRVAAFHETCPTDPETGDHVHSDWREISFTTGIACFAPTNLAVTPESITAREATVTWEGTSDSYVVMIGEENFAVSADFETGDLSQAAFTSTSSYPWTVVANSHSGAYCAKSGNELQNSTTSYLYLEVNLTADMTLTFSAKVSSESGYDKAYFDIDGVTKINGISGDGNWIDYSYPLTAGTHSLSWRYTKDTSTASNDDCFYVDDIVVSAGVDSWTDYNANAQTYTFTNLTPNRHYQVKVTGYCGDEGYSQETAPVGFTTLESCFSPTDLAASNVTAHEATISWTSAAEAWQICVNDDEENLIDVTETTYNFTSLAPETTYTVKVRTNCGDEYSDWTDNVSFTTDVACPAPTGLTVSNITGHEATLNWQGTSNEYQVRYRTAAYMDGIEEGFSSNPAGWSYKTGALNADGTATLSDNTSWSRGTRNGVFDTHIYMNMYSSSVKDYWLITSSMEIQNGYALSFDMAYTAYSGTQATPAPNSPTHRFAVLISTDDMQHWIILREWNNSGSEYVLDQVSTNGENSGNIDLSAYVGQTAYIAFFGHAEVTNYDNNFHFDNVAIGIPVPAGEMQYATNITEETVTLQGLLAETEYEAWLQGDCGSEGLSTEVGPITFTTAIACPAPTGLASTEISGYTAKLNWTGYSESYIVYYRAAIYKAANLAGEWETVSVDEPPCILAGLTPETTYEAKVQGDCGDDGLSLETYITFTTDIACPTPTNLTTSNITANSAVIAWTGNDDAASYNLRYATGFISDFFEDFENGLGQWTVVRSGEGDGNTDWHVVNSNTVFDNEAIPAHSGNYVVMSRSYNGSAYNVDNWLISPQVNIGSTMTYWVRDGGQYHEHYDIYVSTTTTDISAFTKVYEPGDASAEWTEVTVDLSAYDGQTGYVAFRLTDYDKDFIFIDDITITFPSTVTVDWTTVNDVTSPYTIEGLTPETKYTAAVQAVYADGISAWASTTFTTLALDAIPLNLQADVMATTATLTWDGAQDSYNVRYRSVYYYNSFNTDEDRAGWSYSSAIYGVDDTVYDIPASSNYFLAMGWSTTAEEVICSPELPAYPSGSTLEFYHFYLNEANTFQVGYSTTTNDATAFTWSNPIAATVSYQNGAYTVKYSQVLPDGVKYVAFKATAASQAASIFIDNFKIYKGAANNEWEETVSNVNARTLEITGLTPETEYEWQVQGNMTNGTTEWSERAFFTTMDVIIWNNPDDWTVPEAYADVTVPANTLVIIPDGCIARPSNITFEENGSLTIEPGGQLVHDQDSVVATVVMDIIGYGDGLKNNYYLIASPLRDPISPMAVENMTNNVFDLYKFDQSNHNDENEYLEWVNYHGLINGSYPLVNTEGYLYANSDDVMPRFTGEVRRSDENVEVGLIYDDDIRVRFNGWNLVGNPFVCNAFVLTEQGQTVDFYEIVGDSLSLTTNNEIAPCQGIFVQAESDVQTVTFSRTAPAKRSGVLNMNLTKGRAKVDMARIRFGEGRNLGRLSFNDNSSKLYIPMDGKDYAVVYSEGMGEMPVSFKAEYNGTYTLGFSNSEVSFSYLHLIDNMTGADVDLLQTPNYSFEASTTDYASRFKLVFCTGNAMEDNFAFFSNGSFVINNEGEATLQVIDVTGRIVKSESINGSASVNVNAAAGVYMLRLINGNDVKVQKIVVK